MNKPDLYRVKSYDLFGLTGISDDTLRMHVGLYEGYVNAANALHAQLEEFRRGGRVDQEAMPAYSELTRRLGFEYNGMVLHEYYFGNLMKGGGGDAPARSRFFQAAETSCGSYQVWKEDFISVGKMRGVGWTICYQDPQTGQLSNHWITLHQVNNVAGYTPILVMDVWEHAFLLDYAPAERPKYIEAFFSNINWQTIEQRLKQSGSQSQGSAS